MQPWAAQCRWSVRISSWKVIAKRGTLKHKPARSVDSHAPQEVDALQPASELRLDEPGEERPGLGPERRGQRLAGPRRDVRAHTLPRPAGPRGGPGARDPGGVAVESWAFPRGPAAERARIEGGHEPGEGERLQLEGEDGGGPSLTGVEPPQPLHGEREKLRRRLVVPEQLPAE